MLHVAAGAEHGICCQFGVLEIANVILLCRDRLETCNLYELEIRKKEHEISNQFFIYVFTLGRSVPSYIACVADVRRGRKEERRAHEARKDRI